MNVTSLETIVRKDQIGMRGFPEAYTNYTTIRPQCLNPNHLFSRWKRPVPVFVCAQPQLAALLNRWHIPWSSATP